MKNNYLMIPLKIKGLSWSDKIVLSQLAYLKRSFREITASNEYLANKLDLSVSTVKRAISNLSEAKYIVSNLETKNNKTKRNIKLTSKTIKIYDLEVIKVSNNKAISEPLRRFLEN